MDNSKLSLSIPEDKFAVCRLDVNEKIPAWAASDIFYSISRTKDELSIVCPEKEVPEYVKSEKGWRAIKVEAVLGFSQTGILASLAVPLAEAKISIFAISTFNTDYIFVKDKSLDKAVDILKKSFDVNFRLF